MLMHVQNCLIFQETFLTREEGKQSVFEYVECFYNAEHIHSAIPCLHCSLKSCINVRSTILSGISRLNHLLISNRLFTTVP